MKLLSYFLIIALLIVVVGGVGYYYVTDLEKVTVMLEQEASEVIDFGQFRLSFILQYAELDDYIETQNPRAAQLYHEKEHELLKNFEELKRLASEKGDVENFQALEGLDEEIAVFNSTGLEIIALVDKGDKEGAIHKELYQLAPQLVEVQIVLGEIIEKENKEFVQEREDAIRAASFAKNVVLGISIVSVLFVIGLGLFITGRITKPLAKLTQAVDEVSRGNLSVQIEKTKSIKEINVLTDSLERVMTSMKRAIKRLKKE